MSLFNKNYSFRVLVLKFISFVLLNFLFVFQFYFFSNFFFSSRVDEEFVVCLAIFLVFLVFINQIVQGIQDTLKTRSEIYFNSFVLTLNLIRKALKRIKKHNSKFIFSFLYFLSILENFFVTNLVVFYNHSVSMGNYLINTRFKMMIETFLVFYSLNFFVKKNSLVSAYSVELKFEDFLKNLV